MPAFGNSLFPPSCDQRLKSSRLDRCSSQQPRGKKIPSRKKSTWNCWSKWMQHCWKPGVALPCNTGVDFGSVPSAHYRNWKPCNPPHRRHEVSSVVRFFGFKIPMIHIKMSLFPALLVLSLPSSLWWRTQFLTQTSYTRVMEWHFKLVLYNEKELETLCFFVLENRRAICWCYIKMMFWEFFDSKSTYNLGNFT